MAQKKPGGFEVQGDDIGTEGGKYSMVNKGAGGEKDTYFF